MWLTSSWSLIVAVAGVLSESKATTSYWRKLKQRLKEEDNETVTNRNALKMTITDKFFIPTTIKQMLTNCKHLTVGYIL